MNEYIERLRNQKENYNKKVDDNENQELPHGIYHVYLKKLEVKKYNSGIKEGQLYLNWWLCVLGQKYANKIHFLRTPLEGEFTWITRTNLEKIGFVHEDPSEVYNIAELVNKQDQNIDFEIDFKLNNKGYGVTYIVKIFNMFNGYMTPNETSSIKNSLDMDEKFMAEAKLNAEAEMEKMEVPF